MPQITVKLLSGQEYHIEVSHVDTTLELKHQIQSLGGSDVALQRVLFEGKVLEDGVRLSDAGVRDHATLYVMLRQAKEQVPTRDGLQALLDCHEITIAQADDLEALRDYDIVFILDDSGSMSTADTPGGPTRWDELKQTVQTMIEFASYFDSDGTDLHFLNRSSVTSVTDPEDPRVSRCFQQRPSGSTPLTEKVQTVVTQHRASDRALLLVIATDGEPNGGSRKFKNAIESIIADPSKDVRFQIMACTDDDSAVAWLNEFDDKFSEVDVCDDYHSERKEVLQAGRVTRFTRADWVMKALLGPVSQKFDDWDKGSSSRSRGSIVNFFCIAAVAVAVFAAFTAMQVD